MSLSICLITADPPARVAAILEPLRPYAEEIVIAADSRMDEETLVEFAAIADKLFSIEFRMPERHLAWLYSQCDGDWILRLDGDEVPSRALVRRLPQMLTSRNIQQFWISTAWLFPGPEHYLADAPWSTAFVNRLVRNDGTLRVSGKMHSHAEPVTPREYVEDPLYHLDLLLSPEKERRNKIVQYEVARPRLLAPGGGRLNEAYYLPELRGPLELRRVPEEDRAAIAKVLNASSAPTSTASVTDVPLVSLAETDRMWDRRIVRPDAYQASIEPHEQTVSLAPSERRHVVMRVRNDGGERWPANLDEQPPIRLSYRWLNPDGSVHTPEGPRSAFPRTVDPGECVLAPLHVDAPEAAGEYLLEVDVVHEGVRWFDCACRVTVRVENPLGLPPTGGRLRTTSPPRCKRWRRIRIPPTIHRVWLGDAPMSVEQEQFGQTFAEHHPSWTMRLWTDSDLATLDITADELARSRSPSELSNLIRYEVLHRFGGVYVDTDVECLRSLVPLLRGTDAFAALEAPGSVGTAILGSIAGHPALARAALLARRTLGVGTNSADANGPYFFSLILEQEPDVTIFGAELFYPYLWNEPERRHETFPDAYAVHHWAMSWQGKEGE